MAWGKQTQTVDMSAMGKKLNFKNLNSTSHPDINSVLYIEQDSLGYIWIGTGSAICRYDGLKIKSFHIKDSLSNPINNTFFAILQLDKDQILLCSHGGVYIVDKRTLQMSIVEGTQAYKVYRAIRSDDKNLVWLTTNRHILLYNIEFKTFKVFDPVEIIPESGMLTNLRMYGYKGESGQFMIGTYSYVLLWNKKLNKFDYFPAPRTDKSRPSHVGSIIENRLDPNLLYLGTEQGLFLYNRTTKESHRLLETDRVDALLYDPQGRLWVGTSLGLFCFDKDNHILGHYTHIANDPTSLSGNLIHNLLLDRQNNLWIGTGRGVSMVSLSNKYQQFNIHEITSNTRGNNIHKIAKDRAGNLIMGGDNGVIIYNELSGRHIWLSSQSKEVNHRLLTDNVVNFRIDKNLNLLWICTSQGLHCYDMRRDLTRHFNIVVDNPIFHSGWVYDVVEDQQGLLYLSTYENGLFVVDKSDLLNSRDNAKIKAKRHYNSIDNKYRLQEKQEIPWVCFSDSISMWVYYQDCGIEQIVSSKSKDRAVFNTSKGNINSNHIVSVTPIYDGKLLVLNSQGLGTINPSTNQWQELSVDGVSNNIRKVLIADSAHILAYNKSVIQFVDLRRGVVTQSIEMPQNIYINDLFFDSLTQRIYYSSPGAYGYFETRQQPSIAPSLPVLISDLLLMGENVEVGQSFDGNVILPLSIEYMSKIDLQYNQNTFTVQFAAPGYSSSAHMVFQYRLLGFSDQWVSNNYGEDQAKFLNIPSGDYVFQVALIDHTGNRRSSISSIDIRINNPWWSSRVAYTIYWLLVGGGIVFLWFNTQKRSRAKIDKIKREKSIRYSQMKIAFLTNIFKRIDEPLTNIINQTAGNATVKDSTDQLRDISSQFLGIVNTRNEQIDFDQNQITSQPLWVDRSNIAAHSVDIPESPDAKFLQLINKIVEHNIQDIGLSVVVLSQQSGLSTKRIYHLLKTLCAMTPTDYIRHIRLERAAILLRQGGCSVSEVLYLVGFSSHSYFTKCFKSKYGTTPREWARRD